jgi:amino acid adenylation domain-containing protein
LMVGLVGILKAGGAYVPLNPDNPKSRLEQQLSGVQVLVTQSSWREKFPEFAGTVVCLDGDRIAGTGKADTRVSAQPATNPAPLARPENLVYVIYTSGSTGVPKGVQIEHRNLVNYARFMGERLGLQSDAEGLQFATVSTLSADLGNTCIYPALISGGTVHLVSYEEATDVARLGRYVEQHAIDVLKIVPSHLAALLSSAEGGKVLPRKYLITGGEALSQRLLDRIAELQAGCEVINHYGPTETTVGSLTLRLQEHRGRKWDAPAIAIGRPIANTRVYILDPKLQPVPVGVVGELYLGGAGVGRGYRNQPQMTAERFLKDPFVHEPKARLYRTGDLARYLEDGNVEFLGRADDQVKVRGFRIELGEIESALAAHPGVKHAVVLAREDPETGEKRLVGYVVLHREPPTTVEALRQHLGGQLPEYMVPSALVILDKLPLNANGKVDRQALPSPEAAGQAQPRPYLAPRTPVEEVVANIWAEVLRLPQVGAEDNFFALGGHSLLATQVVSRIRRVLGVEFPLRMMFEAPTVEKLAERIEVARRSEEGLQAPPPISAAARDSDLPLSFAQQRLWFLDQLQPNNPVYNIPRAIRIRGRLNVQALEQSLNEIVRRHESQRTVFKSVRGQPVQIVLPACPIQLPVVDLSSVPDSERTSEAKRLAVAEAKRPFDLAKGPLLRITLLRLSDDDHVLLLNTHHIVSDAWSAAVMIEEIGVLYEAFAAHRPSPLPEPAIQYADFAAWQRQWLQGEVLQKQLAYWRTALEGAPAVLELPTDRPRPEGRTFRGDYELVAIPRDLIEQLKAFSRKEDTTLFMTLMTAFQALLSRYSGQEHIIVGTDLAGRTSVDTERLIGFFISVLPIHGDLSGDPRFREFLKKMRNVALGAYAHQDLPLDKIVEELQPERSMSHNPLVQVLFVMQNTPRAEKKFADLTFHAFEVGVAHSKFDLAVFMVEQRDGILGSWLYSRDLFDAPTIRRMAGHYENMLRSIVAQPDARISALEFQSEAEKQEQAQQAEDRKNSQRKKIFKVQPKAVSLPEAYSTTKE